MLAVRAWLEFEGKLVWEWSEFAVLVFSETVAPVRQLRSMQVTTSPALQVLQQVLEVAWAAFRVWGRSLRAASSSVPP